MEEKSKEEFLEEFKKADGGKKLDMWDFALSQQVGWENIIAGMQRIAQEQGVDKKLDKRIKEEMEKAEEKIEESS
ncbi:MAG: hypothetical protein V5A64_03885 [Candidatus Thermoplasmatota archaeon]